MFGTPFAGPRRELRQPERHRQLRPSLEGLESRELLTATPLNGGQWVYSSRVTFSIVPDGTSIGGISSDLNAKLTASMGSTWLASIQKAATLWEAVANVNLAQVSDNGANFGAAGNQQGDSRFGDIRFSMIPQGGSTLAFAMLPPPINGGSNAGDIVLNSNVTFGSAGYDLTTVAIHEFGHALGLDHSPVANDVMYAYYNGTTQTVSSDDAAALSSVYGVYPSDTVNDQTAAAATPISLNSNGTATVSVLSLAGPVDVDWYSLIAPSNTNGTLTVSMQTSNLSSASPRVIIFAANGTTGLVQATAPNVYGTTVTVSTSVVAGTKYYIKALPASVIGAFGNYGLLVSFTSTTPAAIVPPSTVVAQQADQRGGSLSDTDASGQTLLQRVAAELNSAVTSIGSTGQVPLSMVLSSLPDFFNLAMGLSNGLGRDSSLFIDAQDVFLAFASGQPTLELAAANNFLANVVQAGTITSYGDALTVSQFNAGLSPSLSVTSHRPLNLSDYKVDYAPASSPAKSVAATPVVIWTNDDAKSSSKPFDTRSNRAYPRNG